MTRTTEQKAPKVIADLIANLTALTTNQPTTAEIEEALLTSKAITRGLLEWLGSRYTTQARAHLTDAELMAAQLRIPRETLPPTEFWEPVDEFDLMFLPDRNTDGPL
jgi:hypothetical protein